MLASVLAFCLILHASATLGKERVEKRFDETGGLTVSTVYTLTQDEAGFLWIGTTGGLVRFDGLEMRPWARDFSRVINFLLAGSGGEVLILDEAGMLSQIGADGVQPFLGPDGKPLNKARSICFSDDRSNLWVAAGGALLNRGADHSWRVAKIDALAGEELRRVKGAPDDGAFLVTDKGIWRTGADQSLRKILDVANAFDVVSGADGALYVLTWPNKGEIIEAREGRTKLLLSLKARPIGLALRGRVLWASFDRYLVAIRPNEPPEILGPDSNLPSGGPLLVDREGSLWMGTFRGLIQYPEPETVAFSDRDGLPSAHTRFLTKTDDGIWVSTWQGLGRLKREGGGWKASDEAINHIGPMCLDSLGALWVHGFDGDTMRFSEGRFSKLPLPPFKYLAGCAPAEGGWMWLATERGLLLSNPDQRSRFVGAPPGLTELRSVFQDGQGRLWVSSANRICRGDVRAIESDGDPSWSCKSLEGAQAVTDILQMPGGNIWASTHNAGVWRFDGEEWRPIQGSRALPSGRIWGMALSQSGGVWILGDGVYVRVVERSDSAEGWEVVERLSSWQGLLAGEAEDLIEEPDGGLWIATIGGVAHVPPEARRATPLPPHVELVNILLNGQRAPLGESLQLPFGQNQLELHFAALSYRDRNRLRYQYRLHPSDSWTESASSVPQFRFVNLSAGEYVVEIRASLDGARWSPVPAGFGFKVLSPWFARWWVLMLFGLLVGGSIYTAYRVRLAVLLRLERQRTRIAMDLHDELGSGLGSIGILSNIVSDGRVDDAERRSLASKIAETSRELGTALTDIVWALAPASNDLESLAYHLAEHAERLFAGDRVSFSTEFPDVWPRVGLSLATRRNLQLIALEALHNVARHASASRVVLGLKPRGRKWEMWVADDGVGLGGHAGHKIRKGMGLESMKRRAADIGADISWSPENGGGTVVTVTLQPRHQK